MDGWTDKRGNFFLNKRDDESPRKGYLRLLPLYMTWTKNKAGYTAIQVPCAWAGAVIQFLGRGSDAKMVYDQKAKYYRHTD